MFAGISQRPPKCRLKFRHLSEKRFIHQSPKTMAA